MDRIWVTFAENGNIRKWQSAPFDGASEYRLATALEATASPKAVVTDAMISGEPFYAEEMGAYIEDPWEQVGYFKEKLRQAESEAAAWKERAMALRLSLSAALPLTASPAQPKEWRCYHCDEVFSDDRAAREHFGFEQCRDPACRIKLGAERSLVTALRRAEKDAADAWNAIHNETTDSAKAYHAQAARHQEQLRVVEEEGYERGLADGQALTAPPAAGQVEVLRAFQSWLMKQRTYLVTTDPDFMAKHDTLKAVGKHLREVITELTSDAALTSPAEPAPATGGE